MSDAPTDAPPSTSGHSRAAGHHHHSHDVETSYGPLLALYAAAVVISSSGLRTTGRRLPAGRDLVDTAMLGVAAHAVSRLVATSPLAGPLRPDVRLSDGPARAAVADTLSCPTCLMFWAATGLTFASHQAPRQTRLAVSLLVSLTTAELLQGLRDRLAVTARGTVS